MTKEELINAVNEIASSTLLDWAPIVLSFLAVVVAIYVPSKIAKSQNQIAIFDRLYEAYSRLLLVRSFAGQLKEMGSFNNLWDSGRLRTLACVHFESCFGYGPDISDPNNSIGKAIASLRKSEAQANMLPLLISKNRKQKEKCDEMLSALYEPLFVLATEIILFDSDKASETDCHIKEFVDNTEKFFDAYADIIEAELLCNKK